MRLFSGFKLAKNFKLLTGNSFQLFRNTAKLFASENKDPFKEKTGCKSSESGGFAQKVQDAAQQSAQQMKDSAQYGAQQMKDSAQQGAQQMKDSSQQGAQQAYSNLKDAPGLYNFFSTQVDMSMNQPIDKLIVADHNFLRSLYQELNSATSKEDKTKWRNMLVYEIARHSIAEELILYPFFRSTIPKGEEHFQKSISEHHEVKEKLIVVQNLEVTDPTFKDKLDDVCSTLLAHIEKEENEILPELNKVTDEKTRISYGNQYARRKFIVPTRPHTIIPEDPPTLNSILGLLTAPIDKFRDIFASYPDQTKVADLKKEACESVINKDQNKGNK